MGGSQGTQPLSGYVLWALCPPGWLKELQATKKGSVLLSRYRLSSWSPTPMTRSLGRCPPPTGYTIPQRIWVIFLTFPMGRCRGGCQETLMTSLGCHYLQISKFLAPGCPGCPTPCWTEGNAHSGHSSWCLLSSLEEHCPSTEALPTLLWNPGRVSKGLPNSGPLPSSQPLPPATAQPPRSN